MTETSTLLEQLVRMRSVAENEGAIARVCAAMLQEAGLRSQLLEFEPGREQLVARTHDGAEVLTLTGHLDTVPVSVQDWDLDPWGAEVDGDRMVGRGTSDMKSGVAAMLIAIKKHRAVSHECRGIQVVLTSGEETGCTGALHISSSAMLGGGPLLVSEPTANRLVPGHKGALWLRLEAMGKAAHGSAPELGDNAAVKLARAAVALHEFTEWPSEDRFGTVTANVGILRGGIAPNVVPDRAELYLDIRTVPQLDDATLRQTVAGLAGDGVQVSEHVVLPPVDTALDDPFVAAVSAALEAVGLDPEPGPPARFFTDASALIPLLTLPGASLTPTIILGPGEPDQCHVANEWCSLQRLEQGTAVYTEILNRWCSP